MTQTLYTDEIAAEICERLSNGEPLRQICRDEHMPAWQTVYDWQKKHTDFKEACKAAREIGEEAILEECLEIADDSRNDYVERINKRTGAVDVVLDDEHVQRSKLRIWTRLQLLARWNPQKYGERIKQELSGPNGAPLAPPVINIGFDNGGPGEPITSPEGS